MFCADYVSSFFFHALITLGIQKYDKNQPEEKPAIPANPFVIGGLAGLLGAASVYPFDFVRQSQNLKFVHSLSTVPYASVFFGFYFTCREPENLTNQVKFGLCSAFLACIGKCENLLDIFCRNVLTDQKDYQVGYLQQGISYGSVPG